MDPLTLTAEALHEPWRLWTCHFAHFGREHVLANALALAVPLVLAQPRDRGRLFAITLLAAPLLSLLLLPSLAQAQYRGASGLACALWSWVGVRLTGGRDSCAVGIAMLGGLAFKLFLEATFGSCLLGAHPDWQTLPEAHFWGALLGLAAALPGLPFPWVRIPRRA